MTIQEKIYRKALSVGFTVEGACSLLANVQKESLFNPLNVEDRSKINDNVYVQAVDSGTYPRQKFVYDGFGFGLAQWTYSTRKGLLYDWMKQRGLSIGDADGQIEFLFWEMKNYFRVQWNLCCSSNDLYSCAWALLDKWENPDEKTNNMKERYGYAQQWYQFAQSGQFTEDSEAGEIKMTQEEAVQKVLDLARSEIGYHEKNSRAELDDKNANAGAGNWTKYAQELDQTNWYNGGKNGYAWCDVFYDWLFYKCFGDPLGREMICQPVKSAGAGCLYSVQYYKAAGRWIDGKSVPEPGDQIFFTYAPGEYSHTGFVEGVNPQNDTVVTIEGNTSEQVARRSYPLGSLNIAGYGRPKWELATSAFSSNISVPAGNGNDGTLRKGDSGEAVKILQKKLIELGYDLGPWKDDGEFGTRTEEAVMAFQMANGFEVNGIADEELWNAMNQTDSASGDNFDAENDDSEAPSIPKKHIEIRELRKDVEDTDGPDVKLAQAALACYGYPIVITGIFGKEMDQKVRDFQKKKGLKVTGVIDLETWKVLLNVPKKLSTST